MSFSNFLLNYYIHIHVHVHVHVYVHPLMLLFIAHVHVCMYLLNYVTNYGNYIFTFLGFKMSCLKDEVLVEPTIKLVDEYCLISTSDVIKVLNIISI